MSQLQGSTNWESRLCYGKYSHCKYNAPFASTHQYQMLVNNAAPGGHETNHCNILAQGSQNMAHGSFITQMERVQ